MDYCTSLTYLDCNNNSITSLPALPNSLKWLDCSDNQLTEMPTLPDNIEVKKIPKELLEKCEFESEVQ